jgi:hypothetical protein
MVGGKIGSVSGGRHEHNYFIRMGWHIVKIALELKVPEPQINPICCSPRLIYQFGERQNV